MNENERDVAVEIAKASGALLPVVATWIADLIKGGASSDEAEAIVRRNITSRRERYEEEKAEDEAALIAKHGTPEQRVTHLAQRLERYGIPDAPKWAEAVVSGVAPDLPLRRTQPPPNPYRPPGTDGRGEPWPPEDDE